MKILATYNLKGGVGKTTAAVNLAYLSAQQGRRTLLWDLDPQAAATYLFRIRPRVKGGSPKLVSGSRALLDSVKATDFDNLELLPADFTYRHMDLDLSERAKPARTIRRRIGQLDDEYDLVILDTPPSLSLVSENVLYAADLVLAPIIPSPLSVRTFDQLSDFVRESSTRKPVLRGYLSMLDRRRKLHTGLLATLPVEREDVSSIAIPASSAVEQMGIRRMPLPAFAPRNPASVAFDNLWSETATILGLG